MPEPDIWKEWDDRLLARGSWLYDEDGSRLNLSTFFDPFSSEFTSMSTQRKLLILRELFYCGIEPILLSTFYRMYCIEYMHDDLYTDFGQALLEIIKAMTADDLATLNIHQPQNWYRGKVESPFPEKSHETIISVLEGMMPDFHERLKRQKDLLIRRRLVYSQRTSHLIVPNDDPVLDQIDEELLRRVETFEPEVKVRYGTIRLLAEDIHDELDPEHKRARLELVQLLYESIENLDLDTLKELPMFQRRDIEHFVDIKKYPKKWLYSEIHDLALKRDLCKLRGVEFFK
ncbi:MAG: hypothetical protein PHS03_08805 [Sphaerochaeta sp.]|nr:hypothetical protein [Sphaerochaeta sp.]